MVSKGDLGLIFGGIIASSAVLSLVIPSVVKGAGGGGGGGGGLTYTVTVQVKDATGLPLAGASVTLGASLPLPTDASGTAIFTGFIAGSYTLTVIATGYQTATESVQVLADSTYSVTLSPTTTCFPQPCPCGYSWSSIPPCECVPQKIATLSVPPTFSFDQSWILLRQGYWYNLFPTVCGFANFASSCPPLVGCPPGSSGCSPCCGQGPDTIQLQVTAAVKDVNGHPICGVSVSAGFIGITAIPWTLVLTSDQWSGLFELSLESSNLTTDPYGQVYFILNVKITGLQSKTPQILQNGPYTGSVQIPFSLLISVGGTSIVSPVAFTMNANLCAYYPTCGAFPL